MLCPEVWNFKAPCSAFKCKKIDNGETLLADKNICKFYYNHLVSVTVPDSLTIPENLTKKLIVDCEYYKVYDFSPSDLLNVNFLKFFVKNGRLTLLSVNTRIDCDNCIGIIPTGQLILSVNKETFQSFGFEGKESHFTRKIKDKYIIRINLKEDCLEPGKSKYEKIKSHLYTLGKFTVIIIWEPFNQDICPSSIAKYFFDIGYKVKVSCTSYTSNTIYSVRVPEVPFNTNSEEDIFDFVEWLGMVSLDGDLETNDVGNYQSSFVTSEPNEEFGQVKFLQWRGFFTVTKITALLSDLIEYTRTVDKPWISVYVQGFSDSPVAWDADEHHYYTNGDNGYLTIFNNVKYLLSTQKCSKKKYMDPYK